MPEPLRRQASYDDILALPENLVGEILLGELHAHPRPAPRHAHAYSALGYLLGGPFHGGIGGPGGWWIIDEPELHPGELHPGELHPGADVLVPDLAGWRRERMPTMPETAWFEIAPDWVCEILSPSTAATDRAIKMGLYARERVAHLWLVDPDARTLEVYALQGDRRWLLLDTLKEDDKVRQPPFDAVEFALGSLWA